jgi:hypothetical protein
VIAGPDGDDGRRLVVSIFRIGGAGDYRA